MDNSLLLSEDCKILTGIRNKNLSSITIPEGVVRIKEFAFQNNTTLKEVSFPRSLGFI